MSDQALQPTDPTLSKDVQPQDENWNIEALRVALLCPVCKEVMSRPYILSNCGDTVCLHCLKCWFEKELDERATATFTSAKQPMRKAYEILGVLMATKRLFDRKGLAHTFRASRFPKPIYSCPVCKKSVPLPPTKDKTLTALAAASGLVDYTDPRHRLVEERRPFQYLFPCIFTDKISQGDLEGLANVDDNLTFATVQIAVPEWLDSESDVD